METVKPKRNEEFVLDGADSHESTCRVVFIDGVPYVRVGSDCMVWRTHIQEAMQSGLVLSPNPGRLSFDGRTIPLTRTEYRIVAALMAAADVCPYEELAGHVWGSALARERASSLRTHLYSIRKKLQASHLPDQLIENIQGRGLRLAQWAR